MELCSRHWEPSATAFVKAMVLTRHLQMLEGSFEEDKNQLLEALRKVS
jgi:hypothetical protein